MSKNLLNRVEQGQVSAEEKKSPKVDCSLIAKNNPDNPYAASGSSIFDFLRGS